MEFLSLTPKYILSCLQYNGKFSVFKKLKNLPGRQTRKWLSQREASQFFLLPFSRRFRVCPRQKSDTLLAGAISGITNNLRQFRETDARLSISLFLSRLTALIASGTRSSLFIYRVAYN